jgi:hypothetical protein
VALITDRGAAEWQLAARDRPVLLPILPKAGVWAAGAGDRPWRLVLSEDLGVPRRSSAEARPERGQRPDAGAVGEAQRRAKE